MKRSISLILIIMLCVSILSGIPAYAESDCISSEPSQELILSKEVLTEYVAFPSAFYVRQMDFGPANTAGSAEVSGEPEEAVSTELYSIMPGISEGDSVSQQDPYGYLSSFHILDTDICLVSEYNDEEVDYSKAGTYEIVFSLLFDGKALSDPETTTYVIQYGDTLSSIAAMYGTTFWEIAKANNKPDPNIVEVGEVLIIPAEDQGPSLEETDPVKTEVKIPLFVLDKGEFDSSFHIEEGTVSSETVEGNFDLLAYGVIAAYPIIET